MNPVENSECPRLWQKACEKKPAPTRGILQAMRNGMKRVKETRQLILRTLDFKK